MSRVFDGTDDEVRYPVQTISNFTGAYSFGLILKFASVTGFKGLMSHARADGLNQPFACEINGSGTIFHEIAETGTSNVTMNGTGGNPPVINTTDWYGFIWTRAAAPSIPRLHWKNLTTGAAVVHVNGNASQSAPATQAGGSIRVGEWRDTDDFSGNVALDFGWAANLSDADCDSLFANSRTQDFLDLHATVPGAYCHQHNQANATDDIEDLFGNSHTATGTIDSITDTSGIQGTTMDSGTDPPGWTYYSAGPTTSGGDGYVGTAGQWDANLNSRMWY